jgi:hypothetical protein
MRLRTSTGEVYFNSQLVSHVHLSPDHSLLSVHFVNGAHFGSSADTEMERTFAAEFLEQLTDEHSGFVVVGNEVLNLKSALSITIPVEGPIHARWADNLARTIDDELRERVAKILAE